MKRLGIVLSGLGLGLFAVQGFGATTTAALDVSATVAKNCLVSTTPIAFGSYTPTAGTITANGTVVVRCTKGTSFTVALNGGTTVGGTIAQRLMKNGVNTLQYNIYTTTALTTIWGDGTSSSSTQAGTGAGMGIPQAITFTAFGQLPDNTTNQTATTGNYTDSVTATVTY